MQNIIDFISKELPKYERKDIAELSLRINYTIAQYLEPSLSILKNKKSTKSIELDDDLVIEKIKEILLDHPLSGKDIAKKAEIPYVKILPYLKMLVDGTILSHSGNRRSSMYRLASINDKIETIKDTDEGVILRLFDENPAIEWSITKIAQTLKLNNFKVKSKLHKLVESGLIFSSTKKGRPVFRSIKNKAESPESEIMKTLPDEGMTISQIKASTKKDYSLIMNILKKLKNSNKIETETDLKGNILYKPSTKSLENENRKQNTP